MTVCPIALAVGCKKCPAFSVCPLKTSLGDQPKPGEAAPAKPASTGKKKSR
jgi:hypothetical protein